MKQSYTPAVRHDGFGAQYQNVIWTYMYCKANGFGFYYTPFFKMDHNYNGDPEFLEKKERFINVRDHFPNSTPLKPLVLYQDRHIERNEFAECVELHTPDCNEYIEAHLNDEGMAEHIEVFQKLLHKDKPRVFEENAFHIAVHIRRTNSHDVVTYPIIKDDNYYLGIIDSLRKKYKQRKTYVHIYSQGLSESFQRYKTSGCILHLNDNVEDTFLALTQADALVTSRSSFSYIAAFLNQNEIYYTPFWHTPLKHWNVLKRVLIITRNFHHKNKAGLETIFQNLGWSFDYYDDSPNSLHNYDIIYSPCHPIDTTHHPKQRFIFGPHFSVFPDSRITQINAKVHNNAVYIQPSEWAREAWTSLGVEQFIPVKTFCFPVDTQRFAPLENVERNGPVVVYYKRRKPDELRMVLTEMNRRNVACRIFSYTKGYEEDEYIAALQKAPYGIWIGAHESQGFATLEALSCGVPLLVWSVRNMNQEEGTGHPSVPATSVPYWDARCGEVFYDSEEFLTALDIFVKNVGESKYRPREYVCESICTKERTTSWLCFT